MARRTIKTLTIAIDTADNLWRTPRTALINAVLEAYPRGNKSMSLGYKRQAAVRAAINAALDKLETGTE